MSDRECVSAATAVNGAEGRAGDIAKHTGSSSGSVQRSRLVRAIGVVSLVFAGAFLLKLTPGAESLPPSSGIDVGVGVEALASARDPQLVLDAVEEGLVVQDADIPDAFAGEVGLPTGAYDVRVAQGGGVVGYLLDGEAGDARATVSAQMEKRGWTGVALGGVEGDTYIKEEGDCTWALVTYVQEGAATSVVVRCQVAFA